MSVINERAMLVQLHISKWTGRKYDRRVSQAAADACGADVKAGRYNKALIPADSPAYRDLIQITSRASAYHYEHTLPWEARGMALLPAKIYWEYTRAMRSFRGEFEVATARFITDYPQLKERARAVLNGMYKESDYPDVDSLAAKHAFRVAILPVPSAGDFRVDLGDEAEAEIRESIEASVKNSYASASKALYKRLAKVADEMVGSLSDPTATFRDTRVTNIRKLCKILPSLNVGDDPKLAEMNDVIMEHLAKHEPAALRTDKKLRADVVDKARNLSKMPSAYTGDTA